MQQSRRCIYRMEDAEIVVADAGKYGFVKLQGYHPVYGFDSNMVFTDYKQLFDELWENWFNIIVKENTIRKNRLS